MKIEEKESIMNLLTKSTIGLIIASFAIVGCDAEFSEPSTRRPWMPPTQTFNSYYPVFQYTTPGIDYPGESSPRAIKYPATKEQTNKILQLNRIDKANAIHKQNGKIYLINSRAE